MSRLYLETYTVRRSTLILAKGGPMFLEYMTWPEYEEAVKSKIVILPVGALEQHGFHMPLNVDSVLARRFSEIMAERLDAVVLPTVQYGYKSHPATGGGQGFPGTTSLNGATFTNLVLDILSETYRHGGRRFVVMNGHLENLAFIVEAIDLLLGRAAEARVMAVSWWDVASQKLRDEISREAGLEGWEDDHAALTETSLMLYLAPEFVRKDKLVDDPAERRVRYSIFPTPEDLVTPSGLMYKVASASREIGQKLVDQISVSMAEAILLELG